LIKARDQGRKCVPFSAVDWLKNDSEFGKLVTTKCLENAGGNNTAAAVLSAIAFVGYFSSLLWC